ncbi:hypothetical protein CEW81_14595 [Kluyvera genomosp. 3]|uniref:Uncharacterized protein n=1 Tax=Kluyvera genomosp. 3 TaxID=2774055 RepID=A0A248KIA4_9ENTR|nr:hypothetical protein CEW81_14595 [Kluyvera genomosp. 3]
MLSPSPQHFKFLAKAAGLNKAGLDAYDFITYLEWLLGHRGGSGGGSGDFNAAIYATSSTHAINGIPLKIEIVYLNGLKVLAQLNAMMIGTTQAFK